MCVQNGLHAGLVHRPAPGTSLHLDELRLPVRVEPKAHFNRALRFFPAHVTGRPAPATADEVTDVLPIGRLPRANRGDNQILLRDAVLLFSGGMFMNGNTMSRAPHISGIR